MLCCVWLCCSVLFFFCAVLWWSGAPKEEKKVRKIGSVKRSGKPKWIQKSMKNCSWTLPGVRGRFGDPSGTAPDRSGSALGRARDAPDHSRDPPRRPRCAPGALRSDPGAPPDRPGTSPTALARRFSHALLKRSSPKAREIVFRLFRVAFCEALCAVERWGVTQFLRCFRDVRRSLR